MPTTDKLLDLGPSVGQREATFRFDVLDQGGALIGSVTPDDATIPRIENNVSRIVKRSLSGFLVGPADRGALNPLTDRIRPSMVINDEAFPWGMFLFVDGSDVLFTTGDWFSGSLLDRGFQIDQQLRESVGYAPGQRIDSALAAHFAAAGITDYFVDAIPTEVAAPIAWPAGTSRAVVMNDLAAMAGCYAVHFDNDGRGQVRLVPDLQTVAPDRTYELGGNVYADSILVTDNLLSAPNTYQVIDSSATTTPIVGSYTVPETAPHSEAQRGFAITRVLTEQGLGSIAAADARARAEAFQDANDYLWLSFGSAPDPRHDTFDVVSFLGERYREQRWACSLRDGEVMAHDLRRVY